MKDDYAIYEYISINVKSDLEQMYIDCYENFGWMPINDNGKRDYYINSNPNPNMVNIKFKRNRIIEGKEELNRLQIKCEKAFLAVDRLERAPQSIGTIYAFFVGLTAAICLGISVYSMIGEKIMWFLVILFGILGIIGITLPYFIYIKVKTERESENKEKIKEQEEIIYDTCSKAKKILSE